MCNAKYNLKMIYWNLYILEYESQKNYMTSKPLKDFIYESNKGKDIFFVQNKDKAIEMLSKA